jgi:peptide methionine sulfoxide reductase msrA/msrB
MKKIVLIILAGILGIITGACGVPAKKAVEQTVQAAASEKEESSVDSTYAKRDGVDVIYLAGGCFWGTEKLMQTIDGVVDATSGYANGDEDVKPSYGSVSYTGFKETVRVEYRPDTVSLDTILFAYFRSVDPTITDGQGNDVGTQYQAGIYWTNDAAKETVMRIADVEKLRFYPFNVETEPLRSFYEAEEYHQDYLDKNPVGYCHISPEEFELVGNIIVDPADYQRPSDGKIKAMLTDTQYSVTQEAATEIPFENEYWDNHDAGIYVDIVTGEPLFSSNDKFDSGTGWPSFTRGIDENTLVLLSDNSLGEARTEVRSRAGNSHLGHVFYGESESPSGVRFCINSAALRFILYIDMEGEGYGYLKDDVN